MNAVAATPSSISEIVLHDALRTVNAERGSLMFLDVNANELRIRAACGLSQQVMRHTRVPVGRGLAGEVAQTRRPLAVGPGDRTISRRRMSQPGLYQSYLMPVQVEDDLVGVLNVSQLRRHRQADTEAAIRSLTEVTSGAAPCLAFEWLANGATSFSSVSPRTLSALSTEQALTRALQFIIRCAVELTHSEVVALTVTHPRSGRPITAIIGRQSTQRAAELETEVRMQLDQLIRKPPVDGLHENDGAASGFPTGLPTAHLVAAWPVTNENLQYGWLCVYSRRQRETVNRQWEVAASLAVNCAALFEQTSLCRHLNRLWTDASHALDPGAKAGSACGREVFDALINTVCHQVNNPAGGILAVTQLLLQSGDLPAEVANDLRLIEQNTIRIGEVTRRLARLRDIAQPEVVHLGGTPMVSLDH